MEHVSTLGAMAWSFSSCFMSGSSNLRKQKRTRTKQQCSFQGIVSLHWVCQHKPCAAPCPCRNKNKFYIFWGGPHTHTLVFTQKKTRRQTDTQLDRHADMHPYMFHTLHVCTFVLCFLICILLFKFAVATMANIINDGETPPTMVCQVTGRPMFVQSSTRQGHRGRCFSHYFLAEHTTMVTKI